MKPRDVSHLARVGGGLSLGLVSALGAGGSKARAQVEVLPAAKVTAYRQELPVLAAGEKSPAWKGYLGQLAASHVSPVTGSPAGNSLRDIAIANAVRVTRDRQRLGLGDGAYFVHYAVPALNNRMRLPNAYPVDGVPGGSVDVVMARDEYEPGSFVLGALEDVPAVQLSVGPLTNENGATLPASQVDLRVVKVWYQNGNGWFSYFADPGLELVPELLLRDENLVRVDEKQKANYARLGGPSSPREVWISAPRPVDPGFDPYKEDFADAAELAPVKLEQGRFKQFLLTVQATAQTVPGLYRGAISITAPGKENAAIPLQVRVLPYQLPLPKANYDQNKDFIVTLMGAWPPLKVGHKALAPTLKNLRRHNLLHINPTAGPGTPDDIAREEVRLMKEAGFETGFIFGRPTPGHGVNNAPLLSHDELMVYRKMLAERRAFYDKYFGKVEVSIKHGDEQNANWIMRIRPYWKLVHQAGLKNQLAGHELVFTKGGHMLDVFPSAGSPSEGEKARRWNAMGQAHVSFYAGQHNGSENPDFVRRQHGLLGYLSNYDMVNNYQFAYGPWNDHGKDLYKPMVLAYPTSEGLVDTLAWEGFREGIDDVRYATYLRQLANAAIESGQLERIYAGRKVRLWLEAMDGTRVDLEAARAEMREKIAELTRLQEVAK